MSFFPKKLKLCIPTLPSLSLSYLQGFFQLFRVTSELSYISMHICGGAHSSLSLTSSRDLSSVNWDSDSSRDFSAFVLTRVAATVYKDNNILEFQSVSSVLKNRAGPMTGLSRFE